MAVIDVISDVVCPWCFVGKRKLETAIAARPELEIEVHWHPFELNAGMPKKGRDRKEHYRAKFGDSPRLPQMMEALAEEGAKFDIEFNFDEIERVPNTIDAHRLIKWSAGAGRQDEMVERLFKAYFTEARDVGDSDVLAELATDAGLEREIVSDLLKTDRDVAAIQDEMREAAHIGVTGVPTFILASKLAVVGAQPKEIFLQAFDQAFTKPS